jgi:hypothetical protein
MVEVRHLLIPRHGILSRVICALFSIGFYLEVFSCCRSFAMQFGTGAGAVEL